MQLHKNLVIILTIALPLSLIMLVAMELEAAAITADLHITKTGVGGSAVAGGTLDYTPDSGFTGGDSSVYEICDSGTPILCNTAMVNITANAVITPPVANDDTANTSEDVAVTIDVAANDTDPDGNLDPSSTNTACITCSLPVNGGLTNNGDGSFVYTPDSNFNGADSFIYEICDTLSACDAANVAIIVTPVNDPPVANNNSTNTPEDTAVTINVAANDSDVDGNLDSTSTNSTCANGSTGCNGAANGSLIDNGNGTITYTPDPDFNGSDSFVYEICDTLSACDTANVAITVTPVNDPPVATNDTGSVAEGGTSNVSAPGVLGNDNDPESNPLTVTTTPVTPPSNGNLTLNANGSYTYVHNGSETTSDSFVYQVCDPEPLCDTATVNITVNLVNDPPVANNDSVSTPEDTAVTINVTANDSDPDGTLNLASINTTCTGCSVPTNGLLTNNLNGTFTYTPDPNFNGSDNFVYEICDNGTPILCDTATVNITVSPVNDPPSVDAGPNQTITLPANANLVGTVTDDGLPIPPGVVTTTWNQISGPGTVTFGNTGAVDTTASFSIAGIYVLRLTADDGELTAFDELTVTVNASADLSILKQGQPDPVIAGQRLTYMLSIQNYGPSIATGVVVTDDLPLGVNLVSATSTLGTCGTVDPIICTIGSMAASTYVTVTIAVDVDQFTSGVLTNTATVSGDQIDNNLTNNMVTRLTGVSRQGQLLLLIDDNPDVVAAGTNLAYAISITNSGPSGAANVVMTNTLPSEVNFVSVQSGPGDNCSESLGVLDCNFGNMAAGESASVDISVFVPPSTFFGQIANQAVASGDAISPSLTVETTDVVSQADLSLTKTENPDPVRAGEDLIYTLTVNHLGGPSDVQGVVIHDTLPAGVTYQSASPGCSAQSPSFVTCDIGTVSVGETVQATITVNVNQDTTGSLANTATVLAQVLEDPNFDNNTDVEMTTVTREADLAISKSGTPGTVKTGGIVTYTLTIDNNGPSRATDVDVVDNLPAGVTLISATPSQGNCSGTSTVSCNLGNLNANSKATVKLVVSLDSVTPGSLENTANVTSDTTDPDNKNNNDTSSTVVFETVLNLYLPIFEKQRPFGEPNDTCETAAPLALNIIHSFLPEDRDDWYQFDLPSNGNLVVELSNFVPRDGQLTVYFAPDCSSRDQDDVIGINGNSTTRKVLNLGTRPAGHYFIYVSNDAAPSTTPYFLQVIFTP